MENLRLPSWKTRLCIYNIVRIILLYVSTFFKQKKASKKIDLNGRPAPVSITVKSKLYEGHFRLN